MNEINIDTISEFYSYFYFHISGNEYSLDFRQRERKCIDSFLEKIDNWGLDSLWNYFCFAFNYYEGLDTVMGRNNIPIMWVVGPKMQKTYEKRDIEQSNYFIGEFIKRYSLEKSDLIPVIDEGLDFREYKKIEKRRFTDDLHRQLIHCWELGMRVTGSCLLCGAINECKKLQEC
jgi:hypothetical protein